MDITVTLERGALHFEISGKNREEIQEEVLGLAEFIEENQETLTKFDVQTPVGRDEEEGEVQTPATGWEDSTTEQPPDASKFSSISTQTQVDESVLSQIFEVPDDEEEPPFLTLYNFEEGTDVLGTARTHRQSQGSVLVLYLWQEVRGVDEVEKSMLDKALSFSDIDIERRDAMYGAFSDDARKWFDPDGDLISLTTPGEHKARQLIKELADEL